MSIRFLLIIIAIGAVFWYLNWYQKASPVERNKSLRSTLLYGIGGTLILLVITGRIPWLFALLGVAMPWINRALTAKRLWTSLKQRQPPSNKSQQAPSRPIGSMTAEEAYEILGLHSDANQEDIIAAHRKLIARVHPDKGGSDFLAKSINQARETLLNQQT